jgi:hypothetical protein
MLCTQQPPGSDLMFACNQRASTEFVQDRGMLASVELIFMVATFV